MGNSIIFMASVLLGSSPIGGIGFYPVSIDVPWTRPAEWMTLPDAPTQGMKGLIGVSNDDGNFVALRCQGSGTHTIDWGDGTIDTGIASNTQVNHQYVYANITDSATSSTVLTSDEMRQCIVTVTPVGAGTLTVIGCQYRHTSTTANQLSVNWLDVNVNGANLTYITFGSTSQNVRCTFLERVNIGVSSLVSCSSMFAYCSRLQSVNAFSLGTATDCSYMFVGCYMLKTIPFFNTINVTNMTGMVQYCPVKTVPHFNTSNVTNMSGTFYQCAKLENVPLFDTSKVTFMTNMFAYCSLLRNVPLFNTNKVTIMYGMFTSCFVLESLPLFDTSNVVDMYWFCINCYKLKTIPLFNTQNVRSFSAAFQSCINLKTFPVFNISSAGNFIQMFNGCFNLVNVPALDFSYSTSRNRHVALVTPNWTLGTGWRYQTSPTNALEKYIDGTGTVTPTDTSNIIAASVYKVTITISGLSGGTLSYTLGATAGTSTLTADGTYVHYITATNTGKIVITPSATGVRVKIDNILIEDLVTTTSMIGGLSVASSDIVGLTRSISYANQNLSRSSLVSIMNNLGTADGQSAAANTITFTTCRGAAALTAVVATLATSAALDDIVDTVADHGLLAGDYIRFSALTNGAGLTTATTYRVHADNLTARTFQVATTDGVTKVLFTTDITAGTVNRFDVGIAQAKGWTTVPAT